MPRSISAAVVARGAQILLGLFVPVALFAQAPIFPDHLGDFEKSSPTSMAAPERYLYEEYGLEATEQAIYTAPDKRRFTATGWRMHDSTGAMALFQLRRPSAATPAKFAPLAVSTSDGVIYAYGNYVFQFTGGQPDSKDLNPFYNQLPKFENSPLPLVSQSLPPDELVPNSERYILGPVSLQRFAPAISPSVAAFRFGSEGQLGKYNTPKGLMTLVIFNYPAPAMAKQQSEEFQKIAGAVVKRSGPLVAVILSPPDADAAERLLGKVNYRAQVTDTEKVPVNEIRGFAGQLVNIFILAGLVILMCLLAGLGFGGFRVLRRKISKRDDPDAMTVLNIQFPVPVLDKKNAPEPPAATNEPSK
jgi:hypothetical protein